MLFVWLCVTCLNPIGIESLMVRWLETIGNLVVAAPDLEISFKVSFNLGILMVVK